MNNFLASFFSLFLFNNSLTIKENKISSKSEQSITTNKSLYLIENQNESDSLSGFETIAVYDFKKLEPLLYTKSKK